MVHGLKKAPFRWRYRHRRSQRGVSLLLALIFVAFFGGILITMARFNASEIRETEARIAGWEAIEIAKAARLYVRDQVADNPALRTMAATPTRITLDTLRNGGYLSPGFGRVSGGNDVTALGQPIFVIMANWSPDGLGGPPSAQTTVPSAFVYFGDSAKSTPELMIDAVESARRQGASINAPLFDANGTNRSMSCRGAEPAVGLWDTGCLRRDEYATLAAAVGADTVFRPGALIIPVWKAVHLDLRAVMRHPQPENPGFATMLTDLQMGTPVGDCTQVGNQVTITTLDSVGNTTTTATGVCDVVPDDGTNRRFNITRVGSLAADRIIAEPQTSDFGGDAAQAGFNGNEEALYISGDATVGADFRVFGNRPVPAGIPSRFDVTAGSLAIERNAYLYSEDSGAPGVPSTRSGIATIGTATAGSLISDRVRTNTFTSTAAGTTSGAPRMNITETADLTGSVSVTGAANAELLTQTISAPAAQVRTSDGTGEVQVSGTLQMTGSTMTVQGAAPVSGYAALVGEIVDTDELGVEGTGAGTDLRLLAAGDTASISADSTRYYNGAAAVRVDTQACLESARVANACPERQYLPPNVLP